MSSAALPSSRPAPPRPSALLISPEGSHRLNWTGHLRGVGVGRVLEALGPADAVTRGKTASEHGVCVIETAPQEGSILLAIRELRQQGWHRLVMVSPRGDENTVRLALAARVRSFVVDRGNAPAKADQGDGRESRSHPLDLSDRERQVIQCVADGHGNRDVAERLNLSPLTVKSHLSRIGRKLGTGDRAQIVAIAMRAGLIH